MTPSGFVVYAKLPFIVPLNYMKVSSSEKMLRLQTADTKEVVSTIVPGKRQDLYLSGRNC